MRDGWAAAAVWHRISLRYYVTTAAVSGVLRSPRKVIHYARYAVCCAWLLLAYERFLTTSVPWRDRFTDVSVGSDVRYPMSKLADLY